MSEPIRVDPRSDPAWRDLVLEWRSDVFHSPAWLQAVSDTYGFDVQALLLTEGDRPVGGLPYALVDGMSGRRVVAFPFSDYCDPLVTTAAEWQKLLQGVAEHGLPVVTRCLHNPVPLADERMQVLSRARWHGIDLETEDLWAQIHPSARRAVRRSQRAAVDVSQARTPADLRSFYELHLRIRKHKYRMLAQPYEFFEHLWNRFVAADAGTLLLARVDGEVAGGVFFLQWRDALYYKFNASDGRFSETRPNDALMWAGIEHARTRRLRRIDLGLSDWDQEGLIRYKRKYASEEKTISFVSWTPDGVATGATPTRLAQLMPTLTDLLTDERVPDIVTERAGRALYRFFA